MSSSKFHLSLNVHNLHGTAEFLELLLGEKPSQLHADYAKFELSDPAVVLSLVPSEVPQIAGLNHLGFRLPSRQVLLALQQRLAAAGVAHQSEESVACCHSRQTKFWVHDPAGNLWEFYVLDEADACPPETLTAAPSVALELQAPSMVWSHRLGEPIPHHIPAENGSLDEVVLEGTINAAHIDFQSSAIFDEAARVLQHNGRLRLRGLTADRPLRHPPALPGPASAVKSVPTCDEVIAALKNSGFVGLELLTFGETYRFNHAGAELRETRLQAIRARTEPLPQEQVVIYRGPFSEVRDDAGYVFTRGVRVPVDEHTWRRLNESNCASHFVLLKAVQPDRFARTPGHGQPIAASGPLRER